MKILVVGASGSIGRRICEDLVQSGHNVVGTFCNNNRIQRELPTVEWHKVNLANLSETQVFYRNQDSVDIFIYCAGIAPLCLPGSEVRFNASEIMSVNLTSAITGAIILIPKMLEREFGRILFFGSVVAEQGGVGLSHYAASKAGLVGAVKSLNRDIRSLKHKNYPDSDVTINAISPGYVFSDMTKDIPDRIKKELEYKSTSNRFLNKEEISRVVSFVLSESSSGISGANIEINGGINL